MKKNSDRLTKQTKHWCFSLLCIGLFNYSFAKEVPFVDASLRGEVIKESANPDYRMKTIVIDAGHGGHDPGCLGSSSREKHIALAVALQLASSIRAEHPDLKIILTRETDVFIPLHERAALANRNQADLFISIHCNFMPGKSGVQGSETYVMGLHTAAHNLEVAKRENEAILLEENYRDNYEYDPDSPEGHITLTMFQSAYIEQSIRFADLVEQNLAVSGRNSRGVRQAGFVVLKATAMPSALIEIGYLSNKQEEEFLKSDSGQSAVTAAIAKAFSTYRRQIEGQAPVASKNMLASSGASPAPDARINPAPPLTPDSPPLDIIPPSSVQTPSEPAYPAGIQFCIQLSASSIPEDFKTPVWKNFPYNVDEIREDGRYKYQIRNLANYEQAHKTRINVLRQGFPGAFIVAYKNGKRISMEEALKESE